MYLKAEATSASGNGRLQRRMETIDRYVPNVLRSSSHFGVAKSAHPLIRSDDARRTGESVEVGRTLTIHLCPGFRAPDIGLTVAQIFAQKQAYTAQ